MTLLDASRTRPIEGGASFSLGNRLFRIFWGISWLLLARYTPPPLHSWRRIVLRAFGARMAPGARVHASVSVWNPRNLDLGENVLVGPGARIYNQGMIVVGARTVISQRAHLCASSHDISDANFQLVLRPITIGRDCWVAAEAFVGPGVSMGDGAVLGARGALFENAAAGGVYSGNRAVLIKYRGTRNPSAAREQPHVAELD